MLKKSRHDVALTVWRQIVLYCKQGKSEGFHSCNQPSNLIQIQVIDFSARVKFKFDGWPQKIMEDLFYITSSFVHHLKPLSEIKLESLAGNAQFGSKSALFDPLDLEIWWMAIKNDKAPLLRYIKLCASFQNHQWIQTGVTVRKRLSWVMTSVTLTFDLWPWSFAWKSLLSLVIIPENFVMIRWQEHSEKGVTDRQRDGQTDGQK